MEDPLDEVHQSLADTLLEHARLFAEREWMLATSGNVSARLDTSEGMLISASGYDKGRLRPEQFVPCDWGGEPLHPHPDAPSSDSSLHGSLYEAHEAIEAIYHVHHLEATLCADRDCRPGATGSLVGETLFHRQEMLKALDVDPDAQLAIPVVRRIEDRSRLADAISKAIETISTPPGRTRIPGVNVHRHGLYVWGTSLEEARRHVEALAYLFDYSLRGRDDD